MPTTHHYELRLRWDGNRGTGTSSHRGYDRAHEINANGKPPIPGSSDSAFRGDASRWNPEELLVASLAQCHMLWYLQLAAACGVVVTDYTDTPVGCMTENSDGSGQFDEVVLQPVVNVTDASMCDRAQALHDDIDALCFIARSVSFPVRHKPTTRHEERLASTPT